MTDIPEDVMKAAQEAIAATYDEWGMHISANWWRDKANAIRAVGSRHMSTVARAIMAERERCAKVADALHYSRPAEIAATIRGGDKPSPG